MDPAVDARRIGWKDRLCVQFKDAPGDGGFGGRTGHLQKADGAVGVVSRDAMLRALRGFAIRQRCVLARLHSRAIGVGGLTRTPRLGVFHAGMQQQPHIRFAPHLVGVQSRPEKGAQQHEPGKSQACERSASDVRRLHVSEGWSGASATAAGLRVRLTAGFDRIPFRSRCRWKNSGWGWRRIPSAAGAIRCRT